jgi:tetratricopeptide (TPR) repeat protein
MTRHFDDDKNVLRFFRRKSDRQRARELSAMKQGLEHERRTARPVVERLLRDTPREQWARLSERDDLQTIGALECLSNIVAAKVTSDPVEALAVAELAVAAAEGVAPYAYPPPVASQLRAHAWKDLGKALRFLGRNREALDAFDKAEEAIEPHDVLAHDRALVRFHRAASLQELERFEESQALLGECRQAFDELGDSRNVNLCGLAEGALLQRLRRFREAREIYLLQLATANDMDAETRAALHRVIGLCSIEVSNFREAELNLAQAIVLSETLGQPLEVLKSERCLGLVFIRRGELARGVEFLRPIRREFLSKRLAEEAGLCGLDILEALLGLGETSAAEKLARQIVREFTAAGLSHRAIGALGWLAEAIAANRATRTSVTDVRNYIVSLRTAPERDFRTS